MFSAAMSTVRRRARRSVRKRAESRLRSRGTSALPHRRRAGAAGPATPGSRAAPGCGCRAATPAVGSAAWRQAVDSERRAAARCRLGTSQALAAGSASGATPPVSRAGSGRRRPPRSPTRRGRRCASPPARADEAVRRLGRQQATAGRTAPRRRSGPQPQKRPEPGDTHRAGRLQSERRQVERLDGACEDGRAGRVEEAGHLLPARRGRPRRPGVPQHDVRARSLPVPGHASRQRLNHPRIARCRPAPPRSAPHPRCACAPEPTGGRRCAVLG